MTKVLTTHVMTSGGLSFHVEGGREEVINRIESLSHSMGADLVVYGKKTGEKFYTRDKLWMGWQLLVESMIANEHVIEVSDESTQPDVPGVLTEKPLVASEGLVVEL